MRWTYRFKKDCIRGNTQVIAIEKKETRTKKCHLRLFPHIVWFLNVDKILPISIRGKKAKKAEEDGLHTFTGGKNQPYHKNNSWSKEIENQKHHI